MTRTLTAVQLNAIRMESLPRGHLIELVHSGGTIRLTDFGKDLDVDVGAGLVTFTGDGAVLGIGPIGESADSAGQGVRLSLSGVKTTTVLQGLLANDFRGRRIRIWRAWLTDAGNHVRRSEDLSLWTTRGTASVVELSAQKSPGRYRVWNVTGIAAAGVDDLFDAPVNGGIQDAALSPRFYLRRVSTSGTLTLQHPSGNSKGDWDIDLSMLGDDWELIEDGHPALTEVTAWAFADVTGRAGMHFVASVGGPLSFHVAEPAQVAGDHIQPGHYIPTDTGVNDFIFGGTVYALSAPFHGLQLAPYKIKSSRAEGDIQPGTVKITTRITSIFARPQLRNVTLTNTTSLNLFLARAGLALNDTFFQNVEQQTFASGVAEEDNRDEEDDRDRYYE